jgi:hypothetical protein
MLILEVSSSRVNVEKNRLVAKRFQCVDNLNDFGKVNLIVNADECGVAIDACRLLMLQ